jgi:hypothetical protein
LKAGLNNKALPMFLKNVGMLLSIEVCAFVYFMLVAGLKWNTHFCASDVDFENMGKLTKFTCVFKKCRNATVC